ncbi:transcriptional regulator [Actinomadura fibrosa]|uniref:Transcriptional regulator n=1 Tax=Actinomadura fibrosa TaxID=111802 RepID=A0ABW2XJM8_9ACTN|nr:transcriptional regulator [Actinomadura fibrosa]
MSQIRREAVRDLINQDLFYNEIAREVGVSPARVSTAG